MKEKNGILLGKNKILLNKKIKNFLKKMIEFSFNFLKRNFEILVLPRRFEGDGIDLSLTRGTNTELQ